MSEKNLQSEFLKGIWQENPVFVAVLGLCPSLAVTNSCINGLAMGAATFFVLVCSSILVSALKSVIPKPVRISMYVLIIATFVTIVDFSLAAWLPDIHKALGAFIALIVVNCLILGRQEAFASKNPVGLSIADAMGMALGFTLALTLIGGIREILGNGSLLGFSLFGPHFEPWVIMVLPPGGFFTLGGLLMVFQYWKDRKQARLRAEQNREPLVKGPMVV
ncbi:MAG: electron transport complex subunit E [Acidobacteria bacterium]|nr:electron transport complex subunit E [Acidobacteriota bacterium]MCB9398016.1 electron transport complex subunit E [Acidobacteriota bacterium]